MGFAVADLDAVIARLAARSVVIFARFPGFAHEPNGAVTSPGGARVAWFRDADGNIVSVVWFPSADY